MSLGGGTLSSETINHVNPVTSPSYTNYSFQVDSYSWRGEASPETPRRAGLT